MKTYFQGTILSKLNDFGPISGPIYIAQGQYTIYIILGIHIASIGPRFPLSENCDANWRKRIYEKLNPRPIPIFIPIPPLIFLDDKVTPISVSTKTAKGFANRLYFSIRNNLSSSDP